MDWWTPSRSTFRIYKLAAPTHNVVFVVTEHNSVYAFDADTFTQLWKVSMTPSGETTSDPVDGCGQVSPEIGITSTPVIDLKAGPNGTIYLVAMTKSGSTYFQTLARLGSHHRRGFGRQPRPDSSHIPEQQRDDHIRSQAIQRARRAAVVEWRDLYKLGFALRHWSLHRLGRWDTARVRCSKPARSTSRPTVRYAAIWMAGAGLAADSTGNIYFLAGNGTFDDTLNSSGFPENGDYGNGFIKLSTTGNKLAVADYFNMFNTDSESGSDTDLGSGGAMVLPDLQDNAQNTWHLAVGAGKDSNMYIVNRDMMGKFNVQNDNAIYQQLSGALPGGVWAMPAYFNGTIYYGSVNAPLKAFPITNAKVASVGLVQFFRLVRLPRLDAKHFRKRHIEWNRLGGAKWRNGSAPRLRRWKSRH